MRRRLNVDSNADADVVIIGAGHNGLAAGCYLARAGLKVVILEAHEAVGGMICTTRGLISGAPDHSINEGGLDASVFGASSLSADLDLPRFGLRCLTSDPGYVCLDREGDGSFALWRDPVRTAEEIRRFSRRDGDSYLELAQALTAFSDVVIPLMLAHPTRPDARSIGAAVQGALRHRGQLGTLRNLFANSLAEALDHYFTHPVVRGALAPIITAHAPDTAGTGYMLGYFAFVHSVGIRRFQGGTGALAAALAKSFVAAGGRIRTSAVVESLVMDGTRISGVRLDDGEVVTSGVVVSNCDPKTTLTRLVPPGALTDHAAVRAAHLPVHVDGVGELKLDVALSGRLELRRHQAWRADGLDLRLPMASWGTKESVDAAFRESAAGRFPEALPMLCTVPTALDPSQAPEGQDTLWVYSVTAPLTPHEPWDSLAPGAAKALLGDLSNFYSNVEELSIGHRLLGPPHLAHRFRATNGSTSHVDLDPFRMGPFRPGIGLGGYRTPIPGLFLTGAGTHPVPGISGVAGKLSAQTVLRTLRR